MHTSPLSIYAGLGATLGDGVQGGAGVGSLPLPKTTQKTGQGKASPVPPMQTLPSAGKAKGSAAPPAGPTLEANDEEL